MTSSENLLKDIEKLEGRVSALQQSITEKKTKLRQIQNDEKNQHIKYVGKIVDSVLRDVDPEKLQKVLEKNKKFLLTSITDLDQKSQGEEQG
jgi:hypothetical protein